MGHHQGRDLQLLDDIGDGKSFAGAGCAKQDLIFITFIDAIDELSDGFRLVAGWLIGGV